MMLLVSNPRIEAGTVTGFVETSQVALTILKVLGLDPSDLDAVGKEGPPILPGLHLEQVALIVGGWATAGRPHVELFRYREQWRAATATTGQARSTNAGPVEQFVYLLNDRPCLYPRTPAPRDSRQPPCLAIAKHAGSVRTAARAAHR